MLVDGARAGDMGAWLALYRGVHGRLWGYLARRVGRDHADDAVSETICRAVAGIGRFELGPAGFDGWVFGIARRVAADHHRKAAKTRQPVPALPSGLFGSPDEPILIEEEHARVRRAFERLSAPEQELLELRVVAGLRSEQVAAVLHKSAGAIRTAQSRALARLRQLMEEDTDA